MQDEYVIKEDADKINLIGAYYETSNSPRYLNHGILLKRKVDHTVSDFLAKAEENKINNWTITIFTEDNRAYAPNEIKQVQNFFCTPARVANVLKKLPNKTSSGINEIPTIVLKCLPPSIIRDYSTIFNNSLNQQYFLEIWKTSKIILIFKKGKPDNQTFSYRPISLTPNISKVYEIVINNSIINFCNENKIIPDNQFGFKRHHSTIHAINKLLSDVTSHLAENIAKATFIDLEKAFETVWIYGLIYILIKNKSPK